MEEKRESERLREGGREKSESKKEREKKSESRKSLNLLRVRGAERGGEAWNLSAV